MNIILIGYRGCGKTTLGRMLAERLWMTFVDVDDEICKQFDNKTIAQIWKDHGEATFRSVEVEVARDLCQKQQLIIGLGGGTLMQKGAHEAVVQADAVRIYLKCEPQTLLQRIEGDCHSSGSRPNLTDLGDGIKEIQAMLAMREPVYQAVADKVLDITHFEPEEAVRCLIDRCL